MALESVRPVRILLCGFGRVGRAFAGLVHERAPDLRRSYGLDLRLVAVADLGGSAVGDGEAALPVPDLIAHFEGGRDLGEFPRIGRPGWSGREAIERAAADVFVETTPTDITDGEPATTHLKLALGRRLHAVSANKGPFLRHHAELKALARARGAALKLSAATAAALPALDVGLTCLAGARVLGFEGILNGTTNYILTRMHRAGASYAEALAEAQRLGIAETNPALDVEGRDTANKVLVIANEVMEAGLVPEAVAVSGITGVTPDEIRAAQAAGRVLKLVGRATAGPSGVRAGVSLEALAGDHPLAHVHGSEKAITFRTDTMDRVTVSGGKSDPRGAAAALLKDILNIYRGA
jgi:homoserine dehydrogenase